MNERKFLILIKNKDEWTDITKVCRNTVNLNDNQLQINFYNNKSKIISKNDIVYDHCLECKDVNKINIYHKGNLIKGASDIYMYSKCVKIKYHDNSDQLFDKSKIIILAKDQNHEVNTYIQYLIKISKYIDDNSSKHKNSNLPSGLLTKQIQLLGDFSDSILHNILYKDHNFKLTDSSDHVYFPFSYNQSQSEAIYKALNNNISVIEGPPGTGKTQTILNIIANLIINNKTIAIVSSNNDATKNIKEKLAKYNLDFITAFLGNVDNTKEFFESIPTIPDNAYKWKLDNNSINKIKSQIKELIIANAKNLENEIKLAKLKMQIMELEIEIKNFSKLFKIDFDHIPTKLKNSNLSEEKILALRSLVQIENQQLSLSTWFLKNKVKIKYKFNFSDKEDVNLINITNFLDGKYYETKLAKLNESSDSIETIIKEFNFNKCQEEINRLSLNLLKDKIYKSHLFRKEFNSLNYKNDFENFIKSFPIVFSTTNSLKNTISPNFKFDYIIMDESSQIDLISSTIALTCAKNLVVVGDLKQISIVVDSNHKNELNNIFNKYNNLSKSKNYVNNSLLSTIISEFDKNLPRTFLNEHYRCDPEIINFCNKQFYENKLIIKTNHKQNNGIKIIPVKSYGEIDNINEREIDTIMHDIIIKNNFANLDIGIISPFKNQIEKMKKTFIRYNFDIDTIHKFQGREKDIIIISTVKNKISNTDPKNDFVNQPNLLNVTVSRAKDKLYIVASKKLLNESASIYNNLFKYVQHYCDSGEIIEQETYSVMDLLYSDYSPKLENFRKKLINISDYKSENILATVIKEIHDEGKFGLLKWLNFYSLNRIIPINEIYENGVFKIKNGYQFNIDDLKFICNSATHCDFVFFDDFGKKPIFVIELDGRKHREKIQKTRDIRKDNLLNIFGIPILRVLTDNTNPKEKIEQFLNKINSKLC